MSDQLRLELKSNGVVLNHRTWDDEDGPGEWSEVIEFPEHHELEGVQRVLYEVLDWMDKRGTKHDEERIYIEIRPGQERVEEYWTKKVQFLVDHIGSLKGDTTFTFPDGETWEVTKK